MKQTVGYRTTQPKKYWSYWQDKYKGRTSGSAKIAFEQTK